jgi:protein TonB
MTPSPDGSDLNEEVVRLDSQDPNYISYLSSIKRDIELVWEYPPPALSRGIQGRLVVEFRIKQNGSLMGAQLVHSSGFPILDKEAIRAIQAAAPFHPIPRWIRKERLAISASFEYYDNRLKYSYTP